MQPATFTTVKMGGGGDGSGHDPLFRAWSPDKCSWNTQKIDYAYCLVSIYYMPSVNLGCLILTMVFDIHYNDTELLRNTVKHLFPMLTKRTMTLVLG